MQFQNKILGNTFILTGKMWCDRADIEDAITKLGGYVDDRAWYRAKYFVQASGSWGKQTQKRRRADSRPNLTIIDDKELYEMIVEANRAVEIELAGGIKEDETGE